MTTTFTIAYQIILGMIQLLNAVNLASLPTKWQGIITTALSVAMGVQGILAHFYTPTGVKITAGTTVTTPELPVAQAASNAKA